MATVITIIGKGGTGKTTTAVSLADCLAVDHGARVLLVDFDTQPSATSWLAPQFEGQPEDQLRGMGAAGVMVDALSVADAVIPIGPGLDLLPGSWVLAGVEERLAQLKRRSEHQLGERLAGQATGYDIVIVDTPRALDSNLGFNALEAADQVLIALELATSSMDALRAQLELLGEFQPPRLAGLVACKVDRRTAKGRTGVGDLLGAGHVVLGEIPISSGFQWAWDSRALPSRSVAGDRATRAYQELAGAMSKVIAPNTRKAADVTKG
jgi:cellulose biosynthesis protein BcsQ